MSTLSALGARPLPATLLPANAPQADGKNPAYAAPAVNQLKSAVGSPTSISNHGLDLQKRVDSLGNATVDFAQSLLNSFADKLFGDAAKGAQISYDSVSLDTSSSAALTVQHSAGPNGSSDTAAFQLTDSSHFLGKGTITTADGRKFDFEVEVQYNAELDASASQSRSGSAAQTPAPAPTSLPSRPASSKADDAAGSSASADLPTVQVPNIDFPGTLADLFKLIGHDLQTALSSGGQGNGNSNGGSIDRNTLRTLSLRLLSLVDSKRSDTYTAPTGAETRAKSVANAYGQPPAAVTDADAPAASAPAPAAAPAATPALAANTGDSGGAGNTDSQAGKAAA